ncbi:hypothetical protein SDC9_181046 [bioreactor metagenome]|uniref:Uncharacterized protein n=1 Tax=bioreactor metagenome TaxID=1076179 RepID=A0A645H3I0_9ZZZZ
MGVDPYRVVFMQHADKAVGDAHREGHRRTRSDADHLYVIDFPQLADDFFKPRIGQYKGIASGQQYIPHPFGFADIIERCL